MNDALKDQKKEANENPFEDWIVHCESCSGKRWKLRLKLANFIQRDGEKGVGIVRESKIFPVKGKGEQSLESSDEILQQGYLDELVESQTSFSVASKGVPLEAVKLSSAVLHPEKIYYVS